MKKRIGILTLVMALVFAVAAQAAVSFVLVTAERTSLATTLKTDLAGGSIKLYDHSGGTLTATIPLATPMGTVSNGVITIDCTNTTCTAISSQTVTYASICNSGGTELCNENVGTVSTSLVLGSNVISSGTTVTMSAGTITIPAGS